MRVPNGENAFIDIRKLVEYSLDPNHKVGMHKAIVFERVLGLNQGNADELVDALLSAVRNVDAVEGKTDSYGQRYVVDFEMSRGSLTGRIRSVWIVDSGREDPRLITCFVL